MRFSAISFGLLLFTTSVQAMELPRPPTDFSWKEVIEIKAAFLVPDGWHFKREAKDNTLAFFITQEDIDKEGRFYTGVTINVFRKAKPGSAVEYAKAFIARTAIDKHAGDVSARQFGPFQSFGCRFKDPNGPGAPVIHMLMVANPKTGTLYLFIFEAPDATWADAWAKGQIIMNSLAIDDEI